MDTDEEVYEDNDLEFRAANLETPSKKKRNNCKFNEIDFSKPPNNAMTNNSIYLPLTIQNLPTWCLLDTGCSFSSISPRLAKHLNINIINKNGNVKLGHNNTSVKRIGTSENDLKIFYNGKTIYSKLEIFDMFDDIHVCIGMDLLPAFFQIQIHPRLC
jgi:hypothetical protein